MTHPSKRKGNHFERELVGMAKASGMEAKRAYASNGESLGLHAEVDCLIAGYKVQAKRRRGLAQDMIPSEEVDLVACRMDRGEALVVLRYSDWLDLVKGEDAIGSLTAKLERLEGVIHMLQAENIELRAAAHELDE